MYNLSMPKALPTIDVFGIFDFWMKHAPIPRLIVKMEEYAWHSPLGFPLFRPTTGPGTGVASNGFRGGIPRGSSRPDFTGVTVGPPKPTP